MRESAGTNTPSCSKEHAISHSRHAVQRSWWTTICFMTASSGVQLRRLGMVLFVAVRTGAVAAAEPAEHLVVDELRHRRMLAADDALRIAPELQHPHLVRKRLEVHHATDERRPLPEDQLDRLERLDGADQPRKHAEAARLRAGRDRARRRRPRE